MNMLPLDHDAALLSIIKWDGTLDKLAYFLNEFCKLGQRLDNIYFREELFLSHGVLRERLAKYDGLQLAALVDLAREFSTYGSLFPLRDLRRKLEHRCVTVRRRRSTEKAIEASEEDATKRTAGDDVDEDVLYEECLRLFRGVRAAIFYLFWFVRSSVEPPKSELQASPKADSHL